MSSSEIRESIRNAIRMVNEQEYTVCVGSNQHVVHPADYARGGSALCAACLQTVYLGPVKSVGA